jgi:hypothetical protein
MGADRCDFALGLGPHHCQIAFGSRGRLFGPYQVNSRSQYLAQELVCAIVRALEIRSMAGRSGFDFCQLGFQQFDLGLECLCDREVTDR